MAESGGFIRYEKPETPGIRLNGDGTVALYLVVGAEESFEQAANRLFMLVREAIRDFPGAPRLLYLDILGHAGDAAGFDDDFFEFQQEFIFSTVAPFLTALSLPLLSVVNPNVQREDLPDGLLVQSQPGGTA